MYLVITYLWLNKTYILVKEDNSVSIKNLFVSVFGINYRVIKTLCKNFKGNNVYCDKPIFVLILLKINNLVVKIFDINSILERNCLGIKIFHVLRLTMLDIYFSIVTSIVVSHSAIWLLHYIAESYEWGFSH